MTIIVKIVCIFQTLWLGKMRRQRWENLRRSIMMTCMICKNKSAMWEKKCFLTGISVFCTWGVFFLSLVWPVILLLMWSPSSGTPCRALPSAEKGFEFLGMPGGPSTFGDLGFVARDFFPVVAAYGRWRSCTELMTHSFLLTGCWWMWT